MLSDAFCKAHCIGPKLCIGGHQHKPGTITVVLCQKSTGGTVGQGIHVRCPMSLISDRLRLSYKMSYFSYGPWQSSGQILVFYGFSRPKSFVRQYGFTIQYTEPILPDRFFMVKAARLRRCPRLRLRWFSLSYWK